MFPLNDSEPQNSLPFITYLIIIINMVVFFLQLTRLDPETFVQLYAFIPDRFQIGNLDSYFYVLSAMFMHGGFMHIIGNMWFLRIFGDNVEDRIGHLRFLGFYLLAGLVATLAQYFIAPDSSIPLIGASGAVSGVIGAYFVYFKQAKVKALIVGFGGFIDVISLSATFFLGYWFVLQLLNSFGSLALPRGC